MSEVKLSGAVTEQLERMALQIGETPEALAERAVREFLRAVTRQALHQEAQVFHARHADLLRIYAGRYIAMYQGQVVDQLALLARVEEQYPYTPVLITPVVAESEEMYTVRSPRLEQGV
jgi:predicted transcriptional regulator